MFIDEDAAIGSWPSNGFSLASSRYGTIDSQTRSHYKSLQVTAYQAKPIDQRQT